MKASSIHQPSRPIAYVLPTRNRADILARTLDRLSRLPRHDAQVVIADNASDVPVAFAVPRTLANGLTVQVLRLDANQGAAARNVAVRATDSSCEWIVMLDDDSYPVGVSHLEALAGADAGVGAVGGEIFLGSGEEVVGEEGTEAAGTEGHQRIKAMKRESGGLPEVIIGCGAAVRRAAFLEVGGYDAAFGYYAEEYDLCAKLMLAGLRIDFDRRLRFIHEKVQTGRDMNLILGRLVRNNGWVMQRYSPTRRRVTMVRETIARYGAIADKERALAGYSAGLADLIRTLRAQLRTPMSGGVWDRFTGKAAARRGLLRAWAERRFQTAAIVDEGKNAGVVSEVLKEMGVRVLTGLRAEIEADVLVIGTLSPGPMMDASAGRVARDGGARVVMPWNVGTDRVTASIDSTERIRQGEPRMRNSLPSGREARGGERMVG